MGTMWLNNCIVHFPRMTGDMHGDRTYMYESSCAESDGMYITINFPAPVTTRVSGQARGDEAQEWAMHAKNGEACIEERNLPAKISSKV